MSIQNVLITGVTGFVGQHLASRILADGHYNLRSTQRKDGQLDSYFNPVVCDIKPTTSWTDALLEIDCVIHVAGVAHVQTVGNEKALVQLFDVNLKGTLNLAKQAAEAGVKRFIFISSIGVHGIRNTRPFDVLDHVDPVEDYAISKFQAECGLWQIANDTDMEIVIIRPPLVYGKGAPGNFGKLLRLANLNFPLPLGSIENKRSLVAVDNLADLIVTCIDHPNAANQTFLVSDDQDISTTELLRMMIKAAGHFPMLLPFPPSLLKAFARLIGKQELVERFCSSLQVDIEHTKTTLGWQPVITVQDAIKKCFPKD